MKYEFFSHHINYIYSHKPPDYKLRDKFLTLLNESANKWMDGQTDGRVDRHSQIFIGGIVFKECPFSITCISTLRFMYK